MKLQGGTFAEVVLALWRVVDSPYDAGEWIAYSSLICIFAVENDINRYIPQQCHQSNV